MTQRNKDSELVLCFDKKYFLDDQYKVGTPLDTLLKILHTSGVSKYVSRSEAETSDTLLQVIPYCILCQKDPETNFPYEKLLVYKRAKSGSETRLHDKWSVGFGGHINPEDTELCMLRGKFIAGGAAKECLRRELTEELANLNPKTVVGNTQIILHDTSTEVSSVHLGWVFYIAVDEEVAESIQSNESGITDLQWVSITELNSDTWKPKLESWAKLIVEKLVEVRFLTSVAQEVKKDS